MGKIRIKKSKSQTVISNKSKRSFEILGAGTVTITGLLIISVFLGTSLNKILVGTQQYASVLASVLVDLTNGDRAQNGKGTLTVNPVLTAAAQAKANDMITKGYFAHVAPDGTDPWHWFKQADYKFAYAGENLAIDFSDSVDVERAWMNSPTHRDNLLNDKFTEIGIAVASGMYQGRMTTFVVQTFGTPARGTTQAPTQEIVTPQNPIEPALASAPVATVLGESAKAISKPMPSSQKAIQKMEQKVAAASIAETNASVQPTPVQGISHTETGKVSPLWARIISAPRSTMMYIYYAIALCIMVGLAFATGLEMHWHHRGKAYAAGGLLALMCCLFILSNVFVFSTPVLPTDAAMTAAVAAGF